MKVLAVACLAVVGAMPIALAAQGIDAQDAIRSLPTEESPSVVLTPQGAERLAPLNPRNAQALLRSELETPGWSRAQSLALLWTTTIACAAMRSGCAPMPPAPKVITPPGGESWQRVGCKTAEACGWLWTPAIGGPYPAPRQ